MVCVKAVELYNKYLDSVGKCPMDEEKVKFYTKLQGKVLSINTDDKSNEEYMKVYDIDKKKIDIPVQMIIMSCNINDCYIMNPDYHYIKYLCYLGNMYNDVYGTIDNELLWKLGADDNEQYEMHAENVKGLAERLWYIDRLIDFLNDDKTEASATDISCIRDLLEIEELANNDTSILTDMYRVFNLSDMY